jgi:hypothetical protein
VARAKLNERRPAEKGVVAWIRQIDVEMIEIATGVVIALVVVVLAILKGEDIHEVAAQTTIGLHPTVAVIEILPAVPTTIGVAIDKAGTTRMIVAAAVGVIETVAAAAHHTVIEGVAIERIDIPRPQASFLAVAVAPRMACIWEEAIPWHPHKDRCIFLLSNPLILLGLDSSHLGKEGHRLPVHLGSS